MKDGNTKKALQLMVVLFVLFTLLVAIPYGWKLNNRIEAELKDLQTLFDGSNHFKITYYTHQNSDIPVVKTGSRYGGMSMRKESGRIILHTSEFDLDQYDSANLPEEQIKRIKQFILVQLCQSLMLNTYDSNESVISVDLKCVRKELNPQQLINMRISPNRCAGKESGN